MDTQDTNRRRFRIWVAGRLDERFIDAFDDVELGHSPQGSTLNGVLIDQSQLRGILDRLWQLGIEVLRFETYRPEANVGQAIERRREQRRQRDDEDNQGDGPRLPPR